MAKELKEVEEIFSHISNGNNFLLSGGAGSGKTYSLVEVLNKIFELKPTARVACITYTNVAVKQINERIKYENLRVSTIHDFLWDNVKLFQKNLKEAIVSLIKEEKIKDSSGEITDVSYFNRLNIEYREWVKVKEGTISHDEVIDISEYMFAHHPILSDILKDKYDYILIDEYQDTSTEVISILLGFLQNSAKKNIIGFLGDSMQSIYPDTVGNIQKFVDSGLVKEIIKKDNRRNPKVVIDLANQLRTDNVKQEPAEDENAPNYKVTGSIKFLYSSSLNIDSIKNTEYFNGWDFKNPKFTKELYLTHNLIAPKAGFPEIMQIYDKDRIVEFKNNILQHIRDNNINVPPNSTFGDVISIANVLPTGVKAVFIAENNELYEEAKLYPFEVFRKIYLDKDQLIGSKKGTEEEERKRGQKEMI